MENQRLQHSVAAFDPNSLFLYDPESSWEGAQCVQHTDDFDVNTLISYDSETSLEGSQLDQYADECDANNLLAYNPEPSGEGSQHSVAALDPNSLFVYNLESSREGAQCVEHADDFDVNDLISYDSGTSLEGSQRDQYADECDANNLLAYNPEPSGEGSQHSVAALDPNSLFVYNLESSREGAQCVQHADDFDVNDLISYDSESELEEDQEESDGRFESGSMENYGLINCDSSDAQLHSKHPVEASIHVADDVVYKGRPKRGRKRKIPNQSRSDRKKLLNTNKTHINTKRDVYHEKVFDGKFECLCKRRCTTVVPVDDRRRLFTQYWSVGSYEGRTALLMTSVRQQSKKQSYSKDPVKNRMNTRHYSIFGTSVCKKALLGTLQISDSRVDTALEKYMHCETLCDLRGTLSGGWNALPLSKTNEVRAHIASFPKYISHYTRGKTDSKYLSSELNLSKIYQLYLKEAENPVSESFYKKIFYSDFNLRFKKPKKDTCLKCDLSAVKIKTSVGVELEMAKEWHENHLRRAESLSSRMKVDIAAAKTDDELETLAYDQQKILILPRLTTSIAYYKRQLNLYNFGIHIGSTGEGKFNLWKENEASKGTQEVGSCLKLHIESITKPIKKLILWSDSCGGQNRSIKLVLMMMHVLQNHKTLESISLRYLMSGHSFLPNDTEFGEVECALKRYQNLYTDEHYMEVMKECRTKNHFIVNRMSPENFLSVQYLESLITNRKVDTSKEKVSWLDTHEILMEKSQPSVIKFRKEIDGPFQIVNLAKIGCQVDFENVVLNSLWPTGRPLSKEKVKDLTDMLGLIPPEHRHFYQFLNNTQAGDFIDDVDGFGEFIDFDLE